MAVSTKYKADTFEPPMSYDREIMSNIKISHPDTTIRYA